jgi:WD40 repeat protein
VWSVDCSPDNSSLVSCSSLGHQTYVEDAIFIWNLDTNVKQKEFNFVDDWVRQIKYSPDGQSIASSGWINTAKYLDASNGNVKQTFQNTGGASSMDISPDGKTLVIGSYDHSVKLYDTTNGLLLRSMIGHTNVVTSVSFSPDGKSIASGSSDNTIKLWNSNTGFLIDTLENHQGSILSLKFSPDGKTIASGSADKTVKLWQK